MTESERKLLEQAQKIAIARATAEIIEKYREEVLKLATEKFPDVCNELDARAREQGEQQS